MTVHIFLGPSGRTHAPTAEVTGLRRHGPIQHGDLLRLELRPGDVVGIVDGLFYDRPAIRHKEILMVAGRGVRVIGGSSMGALRAADLTGHGMDGVGQVFSWLTSGVVAADHEVAVLHGDADSGYRPMTVALVSVRDALERLIRIGGISAAQAGRVVTLLGTRYFADRTVEAVREACESAAIPGDVFTTVRETIEGPNDVKVRDAAEVVAAAVKAGLEPTAVSRGGRSPSAQASDNHALWIREISLYDAATPLLARARAVQALQLFSNELPALYAQAIRCQLASEWDTSPTPEAIAEEFTARTGVGAVTDALAAQWLHPTTPRSRSDDLCRLAVVTYRVNPSLPGWDALTTYLEQHTELWSIAESLAEIGNSAAKNGRDSAPRLRPRVVFAWLGQLWNCDDDQDVLRRIGYTRGFRDLGEVYRTAARFLTNGVGARTVSPIMGALR